jgi:sigma-B regulation protein RsbU (phosphoserine phosphatase)
VAWLLPVGGSVRHCLLLGRRLGGPWFGLEDQRELKRFSGHLEVLLDNARLREEASTHGSMERELSKAGAIQAHLLPRRVPVFRSLDCAAAALSSEPVGGDYYDFVRSPGPRVTLAVGDAAGKGIPAALMGTWVHAGFRDRARRGAAPGELLTALNHDLVALNQPQAFVALLCARVDVRGATLTFANAGLTPPLLRRRDGHFEALSQSGVLLGVAPRAQYLDCRVELDAGDVIVLYSDGLTEARRGEEEFGPGGVQRVLEAHARQGAAEILRALLAGVQAFTDQPLDDVTVVVLKQVTRPARARPPATQEELKFQVEAADTSR